MSQAASRPSLRTARLELIAADAELAAADAALDRARLGRLLNADVPAAWPPELTLDVLDFFAERLRAHPDETGWWAWCVVAERGAADGPAPRRVLVGGAGFKGPPDDAGLVEIGYSVLPEFQRRGFASEALTALVGQWAWADPRVMRVVAETFPDNVASLGVMRRLGMMPAGSGNEAGTVRCELRRS